MDIFGEQHRLERMLKERDAEIERLTALRKWDEDLIERLQTGWSLATKAVDENQSLKAEIERLLTVLKWIDENGMDEGGDACAEYARRALEQK